MNLILRQEESDVWENEEFVKNIYTDIRKVFMYKDYQKLGNNKKYIKYIIYISYLTLYKYYYKKYNLSFIPEIYEKLSKEVITMISSIVTIKSQE